jgi:hypothetical protein
MSTLTSTDLDVTDVNCTNLKDASGGNSSTPANILAGSVKAWVTFDGSAGSISPAASHNVTGLTDNASGDYTINLTTAMGGTSWAAVGSCDTAGTLWGGLSIEDVAKTTSAVRVRCWDDVKNASGVFNPTQVDVVMIGVQ